MCSFVTIPVGDRGPSQRDGFSLVAYCLNVNAQSKDQRIVEVWYV